MNWLPSFLCLSPTIFSLKSVHRPSSLYNLPPFFVFVVMMAGKIRISKCAQYRRYRRRPLPRLPSLTVIMTLRIPRSSNAEVRRPSTTPSTSYSTASITSPSDTAATRTIRSPLSPGLRWAPSPAASWDPTMRECALPRTSAPSASWR